MSLYYFKLLTLLEKVSFPIDLKNKYYICFGLVVRLLVKLQNILNLFSLIFPHVINKVSRKRQIQLQSSYFIFI